MRKISLQWRLTFMTAALVTAACLLLNLIIGHSAVVKIDEMGDYMLEIVPGSQDSITIGLDDMEMFPDLKVQVQQAKDTFRIQSVAATLAVILASSAITYFVAGRALAPLRRFSSHMEKIQAENLSDPVEVPAAEDEIARLTRSYNEMLVRLDQAFTAQRQFSANAAHELRTPLAVLQTKIDVLQKREKPTISEYAETIQMVSEQTGRLSHLVNVLLEMTEMQTVQRTERISLSALIEEVICDLAQVADEHSVTLVQQAGEAVVIGSDSLLYRAVYNLVENGIKYNRPNGTVTAGVRNENGMAVLSIKDTGIGISAENRERIFEPFVRVDKSRSRAMGGAGLGLALVRDIAVKHGGSVRVAQSSEKGTEIVLALPVSLSPFSAKINEKKAKNEKSDK